MVENPRFGAAISWDGDGYSWMDTKAYMENRAEMLNMNGGAQEKRREI